jgi:hypothetical protein
MKDDPGEFFMADTVPEPPPEEILVEDPAEPPPDIKQERRSSGGTVPDLALEVGLPANVDAERTILGAIMLDDSTFKEAAELIVPSDFSLDSHRRIFLRMAALVEAAMPVDIVTLSNELSKNKEIEVIGGVAYLASLTEGLPRRPVVSEYIRIIKDKSIARRLMGISSAAIARAADQSEEAVTTLEFMEREFLKLREDSRLLLRTRNPVPFFVGARTFVTTAPDVVDWTVEGLIQKDGNGLVLGDSGSSKSLLVFDLAMHMIAGVSWFQHKIPERLKVGLVAREDAPGLSQNRLKRLLKGASESVKMFLSGLDLEDWLYINTRAQRESWTLQSNPDLVDIIESIKERQIQFVFFDVFRDLWEGNENDNQETARVLASAKRISREGKCQVCIIHHLSKSDRGTIFDRARGGGINGWKEWGMGVTVENPDAEPRNLIRKIQFHTKADCAAQPIFYRIEGGEEELHLTQADAPIQNEYIHTPKKKKKGAEQTSMYKDTDEYNAPF